jgi:hypothetical protein
VTQLCFEFDTEPYAKSRWVLIDAVKCRSGLRKSQAEKAACVMPSTWRTWGRKGFAARGQPGSVRAVAAPPTRIMLPLRCSAEMPLCASWQRLRALRCTHPSATPST